MNVNERVLFRVEIMHFAGTTSCPRTRGLATSAASSTVISPRGTTAAAAVEGRALVCTAKKKTRTLEHLPLLGFWRGGGYGEFPENSSASGIGWKTMNSVAATAQQPAGYTATPFIPSSSHEAKMIASPTPIAAGPSSLGATSPQEVQDPFLEIREAANEDDGAAQGLLVILSALRETIGECRMTPTTTADLTPAEPSATEYLAAVLSALQSPDQSHTPQLLALLAAVMPCAHRSLLRLKFPAIAALLMQLLKENGLDEEDADAASSANVLKRLLQCTGHLLAAQEVTSAVWSSPGILRAFQSLLHFFADRRSKVRRAAHEGVVAILTAQGSSSSGAAGKRMSNKGPAAQTMEFCRAVVTSCTSQDVTRALHLLQFMRLGVPLFPPKQAARLCTLSLRMLPLGSPPLTAAVMQMLSAVVQSPQSCMTASSLTKLTEELLTLQPSRSAGAGAVSFAPLLATCVVRLQVSRLGCTP